MSTSVPTSKGHRAPVGRLLIEGQFCGHASLSIVNRELCKALIQRGFELDILAVDGTDGDDDLRAAGLDGRRVLMARPGLYDVHLRNAWPPRTDGMVGRRNGLVCWAWEESEIPAVMARRFNRDLDLILTTATAVSDALARSGVTIPCPVVGNGADHGPQPRRAARPAGARRRVLHVSTCLPRKAPEVLAAAFVRAFAGRDDVELYIKTSPNPHNRIGGIVAEARGAVDAPPHVVIDEAAIDDQAMADLYASADVLALVSRGEGFGLPLAEAMRVGAPVVAARHGGQADFCTEETAFLVETRPARSRSHVAGVYGLWEEPDLGDFVSALRAAVDDRPRARAVAEAGRALAVRSLTWDAVAGRVETALSGPARAIVACPAIDVVSTWNEACGIATYSEQLYGTPPLDAALKRIWARAPEAGRPAPVDDDPRVRRVWGPHGRLMDRLVAEMGAGPVSPVLWFQHHPGYFSNADMTRLLPALRAGRERLAITLHNAQDTIRHPGAEWLKGFDRVVVHSSEEAEALGRFGVRADILPHGVQALARPAPTRDDRFVVGSFGFLTEHKNIELLVGAVALARRSDPRIHLVLANAGLSVPKSWLARARVEALIDHYDIDAHVTRAWDFLPGAQVADLLAPCDMLAFLYGPSDEGASGAARMGLALDRPMLLSGSDVFRDLLPIAHVVSRLDVETVAEAILSLAADPALRALHDAGRREFALSHAWPMVAERAVGLITS